MVSVGQTKGDELEVPPFQPEPVEVMQRRLRAALEVVYDCACDTAPERPWPCELVRNVFDFAEGFRLIISSSILKAGKPPVLHVTLFLRDSGELVKELHRDPLSNAANLSMIARAAVQTLFDDLGMPLTCIAFRSYTIPVFAGMTRDECLALLDKATSTASAPLRPSDGSQP